MAGRSYDLNKTWIPGNARGTTVFNSSGNITVPYGRNKITVSGKATPGNPSTPSTTASYNGPQPATYNPISGGNALTYNPPSGATFNSPVTQYYNPAGSPSNNTYNPVNCLNYSNPSGGNPAPPFFPGSCITPSPGNCVSSNNYNPPNAPYCGGTYNPVFCVYSNEPSGGGCAEWNYSPGGCSGTYNSPTTNGTNQYIPAGCSAFNYVPGNCINPIPGNPGGCTSPTTGNINGYNPPTDTAWTEITVYQGQSSVTGGGYGDCPSPFFDDPYGFGGQSYVTYSCYPVGNNPIYGPPGCDAYAPPNAPGCSQYNYVEGNCASPIPASGGNPIITPGECIPSPPVQGNCLTPIPVTPGNCQVYGGGSCADPVPGNPGNCSLFNPPGCDLYQPAYNNSYNTVIPGGCTQYTGGNPAAPYTPGSPSTPLGYYPPITITYNPPTGVTYNSITPGNPATYFPGGNPATYNPFVSGNSGPSTTVLGVYFPGGGPDSLADYVVGVSNYWTHPDGNTYPVTVTSGGQITVQIE